MIAMLKSEDLKYKRTFAKNIFYIAPIYILIYILGCSRYTFSISMNTWSVFFMPFNIAILCSLVALREKKAGNYRTLKSKDIDLKKMWISKILVISYYTLLASLMVILYLLIIKLIHNSSLIPVGDLFLSTFVIWLTTLILIPICLFLSENFGSFSGIIITCIGIVGAALMAPESNWYLCPWSLNTRLMCPILKLRPNGLILENTSPLLDPSVIPVGIIVGIVGFIVLSLLTSLWFSKKEAI
jgi:ABC-2 type transport system permease protein